MTFGAFIFGRSGSDSGFFFFIAMLRSSSDSMMQSTDTSCMPASKLGGFALRMALRSSTKMWYSSGRPNSGTSNHFVRMRPNTVPV